ncbi:hypothetical protein F442_10559 [Phytophthora nicotianae P10297]|uniref:BED-type domain-containing protein n=1 Tax=Phytophthora nicotianae P10297 TaxID=1317064 RepID=W2Z5B1_PHYNI|nr:hypothetical protein F442_10559 [Phytophthora nicotianae P10297]
MAPANTFSNKKVCNFYFKPVLDYQDEPTGWFRCRCTKTRNQDPKPGYTNLMSHVRAQHPNFADEIAGSGLSSGTLIGFVDKKSSIIFSWIDWVVSCNLPFNFPENHTVVKYTTMPSLSTESIEKYLIRENEGAP